VKVADNLFVSIDYRLTLDSGEELDRSPEGKPLGFVVGAGMIIPGLERELQGLSPGERRHVVVEAADGYGTVDPQLFQRIPRERFPADAELVPGSNFRAQGPRGPIVVTIAAVEGDSVTVDLNHPLAGKRLTFDVAIVEVREPSPEELAAIASENEIVGGCGCGSSCGSDDEGGCDPGACGSSGCSCS
jgi:FKBP-type peptidyl-prolyl cis-trans isomerase SlyD